LSAGNGFLVGGSNATIGLAAIAANSLLANSTNGSAVPTALATSSLGVALSDTTGTLAVNRGCTGATSFTGSQILYSNAAGTALLTTSTSTLNIGGNANTATALQNARTINGTSFDGTADIVITAASSTILSDTNTFS